MRKKLGTDSSAEFVRTEGVSESSSVVEGFLEVWGVDFTVGFGKSVGLWVEDCEAISG